MPLTNRTFNIIWNQDIIPAELIIVMIKQINIANIFR